MADVLRVQGPVLTGRDQEVDGLWVLDGRVTLHRARAGPRRDDRAGVGAAGTRRRPLPRGARRPRRRRRRHQRGPGHRRPRRRDAADPRRRQPRRHPVDRRPRRPAARGPRGPPHRPHEALHPQLRARDRARRASRVHGAGGPCRRRLGEDRRRLDRPRGRRSRARAGRSTRCGRVSPRPTPRVHGSPPTASARSAWPTCSRPASTGSSTARGSGGPTSRSRRRRASRSCPRW